MQTAQAGFLFAVHSTGPAARREPHSMISVYRWQPGQKFGTWADLPELPESAAAVPEGEVWWIDLDDPSEAEEDRVFSKFLPVHSLTVEDVRHPRRKPDEPPHFPKVEEFSDYLFVVANPLLAELAAGEPVVVADPNRCVTQLSAILTHQVLVTHHYQPQRAVAAVTQFLRRHPEQGGRGPDFLFHLILDQIVDDYAPAVDRLSGRLDEIELEVFDRPSGQLVAELVRLKRRVIALRKTLIQMREVLARLIRGEFELVDAREVAYYRNVFDHLVRYTELIEGAREMVSDLMQTHLAAQSNKLNGIMKTLAMVSTIILPMGLIASIYGMNFENMPEIKWEFGYPVALGLMVLVAVAAVAVFYAKKWL